MATVTRQDLYERAYQESPAVTRREAEQLVGDALGLMVDALVDGETVKLSNFGAFIPKRRKAKPTARTTSPDGRKLGAPLPGGAPARNAVRFRPSVALKTLVIAGNAGRR